MAVRKKNSTYTLNEKFIIECDLTLTLQLRALEQDGLVKRTVYAEVPPRVEYELTEMALEFLPIFKQLSAWGSKHRNLTKKDPR